MTRFPGAEEPVRITTYCPAKRRPGMALPLFDQYWADVHGPLCARLPGIWQYTQFHLGHDSGGIWRAPAGVERVTPPEEQVDGLAELVYLSRADLQTWLDGVDVLARDEQNVFGETTMYYTTGDGSRTYVDRIPEREPNGDTGLAYYQVLVKKRPEVSTEELRMHMAERFAANVARHPLVLKLRLHLLEDYDPGVWDSEEVSHDLDPRRVVNAAFEIACATRLDLATVLRSDEYEAATEDQGDLVRQLSVFPVREVVTVVQEGNATLAGLRSASVARTIVEAGGSENLNEDVVDLFAGGALKFQGRSFARSEQEVGT